MSPILASGSMTKIGADGPPGFAPAGLDHAVFVGDFMRMSSMSGTTSTFPPAPSQLSSWILRSQAMCE